MKYFFDTEFIEGKQDKRILGFKTGMKTKSTIDLISIGIISEDIEKTLMPPTDVYNESVKTDRKYYAISKDFNIKEAWNRTQFRIDIRGTKVEYWIRDNVLKPIFMELMRKKYPGSGIKQQLLFSSKFTLKNFKNLIKKYGKSNNQIAEEIKDFCKPIHNPSSAYTPAYTEVNVGKPNIRHNTKYIEDVNNRSNPEFYAYGNKQCVIFYDFIKQNI